ncbi:hypothetical protein MMC16_000057 [Acarospora aff. strigata]|nr:hypothetical protein [Acarospora aff. strigata]
MAPLIIPLVEIPTIALLYKLGRIQPSSSDTIPQPSQSFNNKTSLIHNDITTFHIDSIVNAAKSSLLGGSGVDGAIHKAAGPRLVEECRELDGCKTGDAKITDAYELPCKKVIHTVGPRYKNRNHTALLQSCYRRSLEVAVENGLKSIAFPAISTGIYEYPNEEAAETTLEEVRRFLESGKGDGLERIVFCFFKEEDEKAYERLIPQFFPPTEQDLPDKDQQQQQAHVGELLAKLPDPPSTEPAQHGQPEAKKLKVAHDDSDEEWETVNKPNDPPAEGYGKEDEEMVTVTKAEIPHGYHDTVWEVTTAHDDGLSNKLLKDW